MRRPSWWEEGVFLKKSPNRWIWEKDLLQLDAQVFLEWEEIPFQGTTPGVCSVSQSRGMRWNRQGVETLRALTLENYDHQCALCSIQEDTLLVTSHIARWADEPEARGRLDNTLCLCVLHDKLFEEGFFVLGEDTTVFWNQYLAIQTFEKLNPARFYPPHPRFLALHRQRILEKRTLHGD